MCAVTPLLHLYQSIRRMDSDSAANDLKGCKVRHIRFRRDRCTAAEVQHTPRKRSS